MADGFKFTAKTFAYFDGAREHANDRTWFDLHRELYVESVEVPFTHLVSELQERLAPALPGISFSPRKITKPLLRQAKDSEGPLLRENATAFFSEPATSMFEMNPGVYLSFGAKADDNVIGCGIYMPSSRQINRLRPQFTTEVQTLDRMLNEGSLPLHWDGLTGERYKRFPKGFDENAPGALYLRHKQFFLGKTLSRKAVCATGFMENAVNALEAAVPFLQWTRNTVGIYRKPTPERSC